jgi:hypothetical protein
LSKYLPRSTLRVTKSRGTVMGTQDSARLSERERRQLATIQAMVEAADPELATILTGPRRVWRKRLRAVLAPWRALASWLPLRRLRALVTRARLRAKWLGPLLIVLGLGTIFGTLSEFMWLSVPGAALVALGLGLSFGAWQRGRAQEAPDRPRLPSSS